MLEQEVGGHVDVVVGCSESFLGIHSGETHLHQPCHLDVKRMETKFRTAGKSEEEERKEGVRRNEERKIEEGGRKGGMEGRHERVRRKEEIKE